MKIKVSNDQYEIVYELNDSQAAQELYDQLPAMLEVEPFGKKEITFYPPKPLATAKTPLVKQAGVGTLAYFEPYKDVVMFIGSFGAYPGLFELGAAVSGQDDIEKLAGQVTVAKFE